MKRLLIGSLLSLAFVALSAFASYQKLCRGFAPENDMQIPVSGYANDGLTEQEFNAVMDKYEAIYRPIMDKEGGHMVLNRRWTDATVNAYATRFINQWYLNMFGGLARYPGMTPDGMMLVVCHETGHHLGRAPYFGPLRWGWATDEGGADYFSALKCARKVFADDDNVAIVGAMQIDPVIDAKCSAQFADPKDAAICKRSATAGVVLAGVLSSLSKDKVAPNVSTPDTKVVGDIFDAHPQAQCRLDTYFAASICQVPGTAPLDIRNYHVNSCVAPQFKDGLRPNCWFKPDASDSVASVH